MKRLSRHGYQYLSGWFALAVLLCSSLSAHAVDDSGRIPELQAPVKQFEAAVIANLAKSSGIPIETLDQSSLFVTLRSNGLVATITSRDGKTGIFLTPGRYIGNVRQQIPGVYSMTRAKDGTVEEKLNGKTIRSLPIKPPQDLLLYLFAAPLLGCSAAADPVVANNCYFKAICLNYGACFLE